ncbi:FecR family protein [Mesonia aestuariivivens]|uniref:FecR domain-containing protein n=1 Tax=Mesonia aestuariivivens TaxID=2796128 RepID=A0ABS6W2U7_9FLAO|nr:FecR domain-containing protein [Mesonia aestuariivivens]MBW2962175.1 FecR domain-containing protein [Mesonia aestuariivivens]
MKEEKLIQKWLDGELSQEERAALEQLDAFKDYQKIATASQYFKAPKFDADTTYKKIKEDIQNSDHNSSNWLSVFGKIAAILVLAFISYTMFFSNSSEEFTTQIASTEEIKLPDNSTLQLNASSHLNFSEDHWSENRLVNLDGEAFFKVAKGETFTVQTALGAVSVRGTQFNVKQRDQIFIVTCYEGLVEVKTKNKTVLLPAGKEFRQINQTSIVENISEITPTWTKGESSFTSIPIQEVLNELERQYQVTIQVKNLTFDKNQTFTGSFVHRNLDQALKAITIPFHFTYKIEGDIVSIAKRE